MNAQEKFDSVEDLFKEAQETFQKGVGTLSSWTDQARDLFENRPGIILAAVGISGFIAGSVLRHGFSLRKSARSGASVDTHTLPGFAEQSLPADPIFLFAAGVVAGIVAGPRVIQETLAGIDRASHGDNILNMSGLRRSSGESTQAKSMDERPFEKT